MSCHVGIDVGGTYTDAVCLEDGAILQTAKVPTREENLVGTIINALETLKLPDVKQLNHITVSTTLVTNAILQGRLPFVNLLLFPGNGMSLTALPWPVDYHVLSGEMDFRGREVIPADPSEWQRLPWTESPNHTGLAAIVGKFSHRNNLHETQLADYLRKSHPQCQLALGHEWGQANFYRRSLTTYLNLGVSGLYQQFSRHLQAALSSLEIQAPVSILKADGGILPLGKLRPIESIYSGPAASVLAALTQSETAVSTIVVDIGGTTTDLGLILSGSPLLSARGAQIGPYATLVHSLAVRSIPVGGDSVIEASEEGFELKSYRLGPAYCLGGKALTPTDAMRYLGLIDYGSRQLAEEALASLLPPERRASQFYQAFATEIIHAVVNRIAEAVDSLKREWQEEPAYKVWEVLHPHEAQIFNTLVSGGGAQGLAKALGERFGTPVQLGIYPEVSNALGAAMARPTFDCTLHLDTYMKRYHVEETGEQGKWSGSSRPYREVEGFLDQLVQKQAQQYGIQIQDLEKEPFDFFPIVQNYQTVGQIIRGAAHLRPGVTGRVVK
ncbi:N-methylhydantoinase A/acetone carboxylase, beta subunit [Desulfosporosinus acidiphilus SJ4]|uniref:N-methylhydantoinase A/acetone carboxylase, beta subunit n=1 Tax=Desulfosporosinus acidiphilus (strain DSM 22704 / JCM 16185 / SJ4) TaxID=646529 RepID=I4D7P7_DESAJ|nr:hydantoinase/oxoprolinase family protein [Desulfosporosinus acidiphilus]AFM41821.1 N-methylhydantoinase A/acetone carboxylase, beta subunit [Desulfosporosinus acidiphilus SJ4]